VRKRYYIMLNYETADFSVYKKLNNLAKFLVLASGRLLIMCIIAIGTILSSSCEKSTRADKKTLKIYKKQQKLCVNEMLVMSNKTVGLAFVDLTRVEKNSVDYRWRSWVPNQSKEQTGKGSSTIAQIKIGDDNTIFMGDGCFLKIGDARMTWDVGGDDYIWVFYQPSVTSVCILSDTNFATLTPSVGLVHCEAGKELGMCNTDGR
jgi:hypothetical protein